MTCEPSSGGIGIRLNAISSEVQVGRARIIIAWTMPNARTSIAGTAAAEQADSDDDDGAHAMRDEQDSSNTPASETMMSPRLKLR